MTPLNLLSQLKNPDGSPALCRTPGALPGAPPGEAGFLIGGERCERIRNERKRDRFPVAFAVDIVTVNPIPQELSA